MRRLEAERGVASPDGNTPYRVEVQETRSCGQYDPGGEQDRRPDPAGNPGQREARALTAKPPRWSAARRASPFKRRREAPKQGACVPVMAREPGASQHPERLWRSPPPRGAENEKCSAQRVEERRRKG